MLSTNTNNELNDMSNSSTKLDPVFLARSKFRRGKYKECIEICSRLLKENHYDMTVWFLKTRALTLVDYIDDTDIEEEGVAEILMDENAIAKMPRPGTSLRTPMTASTRPGSRAGSAFNQNIRPLSRTGRPLSGFLRPGTTSLRPKTGSMSVNQAFRGSRAGSARPVSSGGRFLRLGTQSMLSKSDLFIDPDRINTSKYARRPILAKALTDFLLYSAHNPKKALELCSQATQASSFQDPWWKQRLGKCYYQLGMYREAERQFLSALKKQPMIATYLDLAKVYIRLDQPQRALDAYLTASETHTADVATLLGIARIYDMMNNSEAAVGCYKQVLATDASNCEAIACLASHYFYSDQPEVALRFYQRLLQMGINNSELWNNLGLCCFYSGQYDICLGCFEHALLRAEDESVADIWYNIGHLAIGIGDQNLAFRAYKTSISSDANHAESFTNLGILQVHKGALQKARGSFDAAEKLAPHLFEPFYNSALLASKTGDFQESYAKVKTALEVFEDHKDSQDLLKQLRKHFTMI
mmetsp:Transcript_18424/g.33017  ORF Transcript_18424/g.33017 Transcript_18424/m.33017 type:complete len:528 (+) Transcript_18424:314-1897(+)|eukprot:CAMPEP_0197516756 /NCGR_PEP_ID=MMETSP1318-20131121/1677_1 /TAXON_ID=552666 /ORGANISM="Partenskyella glossopodia, Strain RCC365" /LENGTH=527 /DNA_ID=CAMNT_0043065751 /DNA_START=79 /DNA_END=1662 /DNA_ORIENTATION=-